MSAGPPSRPRLTLRGWAGNLLLLGVSVLMGLGVLEIGARILIARRPVVTSGEQGVYSMFDPVLGWRNRPGSSVRYSRRDYQTSVSINALGFRDVERPIAKTPGTGRILALGDSFIEAYTVEVDESVTRRAEAMSLAEGCRLDVVNAGVHGYSTDQEALWYIREGEPLQADVVLLFFYYNDILNNVRGQYWGSPKPLVEVKDGELVPVNLPLPRPPHTAAPLGVQAKPAPRIEGSALASLLSERLLVGAPTLYNRLAGIGLWDAWGDEPIPDELRAYKARGQLDEFDRAWQRTAEILGVLGRTVTARKARPVIVYIPARFEVIDRDWELTQLRYGIAAETWDRALVRRRLGEIAASAGWGLLDLTPALARATTRMSETYLPFDGHWNPHGHEVAAAATLAFLRERGWLPCGRP